MKANKTYKKARENQKSVRVAAFLAGALSALPIAVALLAIAAVFRWLGAR